MTKQNINSKKGFTIIEVVLVLAIAGLIFLMVFIAYPALRRSQSDTQRREDMSRALSQLTSYIANNRKPPMDSTKYAAFFKSYLTDTAEHFNDPDGNAYVAAFMGQCTNGDESNVDQPGCWKNYKPTTSTSASLNRPTSLDHKVYYFYKAKCVEGSDYPVVATGDKEVAITFKLEGGGWYCGSNSN